MDDSQTSDEAEVTTVTPVPRQLLQPDAGEQRGTLTVLVGSAMGAAFVLTSQATLIGRNLRAHVPLEDDGISRSQARILNRDGVYELEDMGSTNGTYVDGVRVRGSVALQSGARIQMGNTLLRFALQDEIEWQAAKHVYEASVRDGLTGVFNRRYFEERLVAEFAFAARHGTALCVLLGDIDHFKRINDGWGHPAGDLVLRRVGSALRAALRVEDVIARYGGEEFAIVMRGIDLAGARTAAERLRGLLERTEIEWQGERIPLTMSFGLAHNHAGAAASDPQRLVAAADKALYAAKAAGRNRVEVARSPGSYAIAQPDGAQITSAHDSKPRTWENATAPRKEAALDDLLRNGLPQPAKPRKPQ